MHLISICCLLPWTVTVWEPVELLSLTVLTETSGSKLDAAHGMYKWSCKGISQVSLFSSIFGVWRGKNVFSHSPLNSVARFELSTTVVQRLWKENFFHWDQTKSFRACVTKHKPQFLSSDEEFRLYLSTARLKNYIRVILQEVGEQHMVNRILICSEYCRWIGVAGF